MDREPQIVANIRMKVKHAEVSSTLAALYPEVISHVNATGVRMTGIPFMRYHGRSADEIDLEAGIPVAKPISEEGRVKNSELPGGRTVVTWHVGPYDELPASHEALEAHVAANALTSRGGPWEVYWTDPGGRHGPGRSGSPSSSCRSSRDPSSAMESSRSGDSSASRRGRNAKVKANESEHSRKIGEDAGINAD